MIVKYKSGYKYRGQHQKEYLLSKYLLYLFLNVVRLVEFFILFGILFQLEGPLYEGDF